MTEYFLNYSSRLFLIYLNYFLQHKYDNNPIEEEVLNHHPSLNNRFPVFSALEKEGNVKLMKRSDVSFI